MPTDQDNTYMTACIELAASAGRAVAPNPRVGALIVQDGQIVAQGKHERYGGPHAEVLAFADLNGSVDLKNCELYVNLEPCSHHGKTPPCVDAILQTEIRTVIVGTADPNPLVSGKGIARLRSAGRTVRSGICIEECVRLNRSFFCNQMYQRPFVVLKWAQTSDGYIARTDGSSKWISSETSRALVHQWRSEESGILVGFRTAALDNPRLSVRSVPGESPTRIVLDPRAELNHSNHIFDGSVRTIIYSHAPEVFPDTVEPRPLPQKNFPETLLRDIYSCGIASLFVEGGAKTLQTFLDADLWDEARVFTAPSTFGDGLPAPVMRQAPVAQDCVNSDVLLHYENHWLSEMIASFQS